jgi:hypothetical protein
MNGNNTSFLTNPVNYLGQHAIECYNIKPAAMKTAINNAGGNGDANSCNLTLEFDLVPQPGKYVSLVILGVVGTYAGTKRKGQPIVAAWMPYMGQTKDPKENQIGRINLTTVPANVKFVFSAGLGGCNFVAQQEGVNKVLYHEPTAASWNGQQPAYNGNNILRAGPAYDDAAGIVGGFGMAMRVPTGWDLVFQLVNGTTVQQVTQHHVP